MAIIEGDKQFTWKPSPDFFDQLIIYNLKEGFVEVSKQCSLPLELSSPIFDLAGMYSPLILLEELPGTHDSNQLHRIVFYQHLELININQMVANLNELEVGWTVKGYAVVSPEETSLTLDQVRDVALGCKLSTPLPSVPDPETTDHASNVSSVNVPWKPILFGLTCFALGVLSSLLLW